MEPDPSAGSTAGQGNAWRPPLTLPGTPGRSARSTLEPGATRAKVPEQLGPYEILGEIARGGMGIVFKAFHPGLKRVVALKVLIAGENASEESIQRFHREAEAVARLGHHPNIVPVYDIGVVGSTGPSTGSGQSLSSLHYIAMHYVDGPSLDHAMDEEAIAPAEAARIAWKIALALSHAHEHGILHRDIKPSNILLAHGSTLEALEREQAGLETRQPDAPASSSGEEPALRHAGAPTAQGSRGTSDGSAATRSAWEKPGSPPREARSGESGFAEPLLTDFGLAKDAASDSRMTRTGVAFGTPHYMPPEQADGRLSDVDARSDVYSLGATLYEMLTLRTPFSGSGPAEVLKNVLSSEPVPPRKLNPRIPRDLETICLKCLERQPARRYPSAAALADDLRRFLDQAPIQARPVSALGRAMRRAGRHRAATVSLASVVLLLAGGAAAALIAAGGRKEAEKSRASEQEAVGEKQRTEELLRRNQSVSTVLLGAQGKLGAIHREFKRLHYDSSKSPAEKSRMFAARDADIERFFERVPSDPSASAAALAVKGWLQRLRGDQDAAFAAFAKARETDPDVAWAPFLEAMHWFAAFALERPLPRYRMGILGLSFGQSPPETEALRRKRERFEACAEEVRNAAAWGGDSTAGVPAVSRGLRAIQEGRLGEAQSALGEALEVWSMGWVEEELLLIRARVRYLAKDFAGSESDLLRFLELCPENYGARMQLGAALEGKGCEQLSVEKDPRPELRAAVEAYGQGIGRRPGASEGFRRRATVLRFLAGAEDRLGQDPRPTCRSAEQDATQAVSLEPGIAANHACLGGARLDLGQAVGRRGEDPRGLFRDSIEALSRAIDLDPASADARELRAWATVCLGGADEERGADPRPIYREAIRMYDEAILESPQYPELLDGRGRAFQRLGEAELERSGDALTAFRNAASAHEAHLAVNPMSLEGHVNLGSARKSLGDVRAGRGEDPTDEYGKAIAEFEKALEIHDGMNSARLNLGNAHMAIASWETRTGIDPRPSLVRAADVIQGLVERQPAHPDGHLRMGMILRLHGEANAARGDDPDELMGRAVAAFSSAIDFNPRSADAFSQRGAAHTRAGEFDAMRGRDPRPSYGLALLDFRRALELNPGSPQVFINMGVVHYSVGDAAQARGEDPRESYAAAADAQSEALKLSPESQSALNNRGNALISLSAAEAARGGDPRARLMLAVEDFDRLLAMNPGNTVGLLNRARALMQLGETEAAWGADSEPTYLASLAGFDAALEGNRGIWQGHANRGLVLEHLGRFQEAADAYASADALVKGTSKAVREWLERAKVRAGHPPWLQKLVHGAIMAGLGDYFTAGKALETGLRECAAAEPAERSGATEWIGRAHYYLAVAASLASQGRPGPRAPANPPGDEEASALREKALRHLEEAFASGWDDLSSLRSEKAFDSLRDDPRFRKLMGR